MAALRRPILGRECRKWVDKRPSSGNNMRLLSLNRGAIHGYRYDDHKACNTVEQR